MRIGYLECFSGISGDMLLGALVDAGVPFTSLAETAAALGVGARLEMRKVSRGGLAATKAGAQAQLRISGFSSTLVIQRFAHRAGLIGSFGGNNGPEFAFFDLLDGVLEYGKRRHLKVHEEAEFLLRRLGRAGQDGLATRHID